MSELMFIEIHYKPRGSRGDVSLRCRPTTASASDMHLVSESDVKEDFA